jgi:hypothetical protein
MAGVLGGEGVTVTVGVTTSERAGGRGGGTVDVGVLDGVVAGGRGVEVDGGVVPSDESELSAVFQPVFITVKARLSTPTVTPALIHHLFGADRLRRPFRLPREFEEQLARRAANPFTAG